MSKFRDVLRRPGLLSARPDAADVISGTLYPATDTLIVYRRKEDATWESWLSLPVDSHVPASSVTVPADTSSVVVRKYTLGSGKKLTLSSGARFRVL